MCKKGFTLLEVMIVVIIIGILAAIALPQYIATIEKSRSAEAATNVGTVRTSMDRYWYQTNNMSTATLPSDGTVGTLDIDNPNAITNRLYNYAISGLSADGAADRAYVITATRVRGGVEDATTWVKWTQTNNNTGKLTRSTNLGGPTT
jgi:type IV pilus assembly protein PilA